MNTSKNGKARRALLVSITNADGVLRVDLDDVVCGDGSGHAWEKNVHVTNKSISIENFERLSFEEKDLADFGYFIMARLHAYRSRDEN